MGSADALTGTLTPDGNGGRRTIRRRARAQRAEAFRDAAALVGRMADAREEMMWRAAWPVHLPHEITALRNAAAALNMVALGYECASSTVGRAPEAAAAGDPLGVSGP